MRKLLPIVVLLFGAILADAAPLNAPAPAFVLKNSQKQLRTLSRYKGKVVFIDFWASWCAPCQVELAELNRLAVEYQGKKIQVIAINVDTDRTAAKELLKKLSLATPHFEVLWDTKSKVVSAYNIQGMPSSFIVDAHGLIRYVHTGFHSQDPATWRQEINGLLGNKS